MVGCHVRRHLGAFILRHEAANCRSSFIIRGTLARDAFSFYFDRFFAARMFFRRLFEDFDYKFSRILIPFIDRFGRIYQSVFMFRNCTLIDIIPISDFRFRRIGGANRVFFDAGHRLRQGQIHTRANFSLIGGFRRIHARTIRFIGRHGTQGFVFIYLAPCNFELQLGAAGYTMGRCHAVRGARKAFCFSYRIGIPQNISSISTVQLVLLDRAEPRYDDHDKDSNGAAFLLLLRPIRNYDTIVGFASFVICANMRRGAFNDDNFANISIHASASIAMTYSKYYADRLFPHLSFEHSVWMTRDKLLAKDTHLIAGAPGKLPAMIYRHLINFNRAIGIFAFLGYDAFIFYDVEGFIHRTRDRKFVATFADDFGSPARYRDVAAGQASFG